MTPQVSPQIDDATFKFLIYILGITFSGLVGIIVFLAKNLNTNVKVIKDNQDRGAVETAEMKKDIANLLKDMQMARNSLDGIGELREEIFKNGYAIAALEKAIETHRAQIRDLELRISTLNKQQ